MRIDLNASLLGAPDAARPNKSSSRNGAASSSRETADGDVTQLSPDQIRLRSLESRVNSMPEIRQERVEALGKAIRNGTYDVTPEQTAEAMLSDVMGSPVLR
jgi:flagellar biosynthesis anti-sigma factor FlgM